MTDKTRVCSRFDHNDDDNNNNNYNNNVNRYSLLQSIQSIEISADFRCLWCPMTQQRSGGGWGRVRDRGRGI